jgi:nitric oxide reductase activation protein
MVDGANGIDSYFINFSDGEPYFENNDISYYGDEAATHTRKQVQEMISRGINVLSYFIGSSSHANENFKRMYGKDAEFINTNKVMELAKSLNKKFATK